MLLSDLGVEAEEKAWSTDLDETRVDGAAAVQVADLYEHARYVR